MKKIFISRDLKVKSVFRKKMENADFAVFGESLLEFELIPFDKIPKVDWIFFYSQKGVQFFFKNILDNNIRFSKKIKFAGFGKKTAKAIENFGMPCEFIGTGEAKATAVLFLKKAKNKKVLFPRAKNSQQSVQKIIENEITPFELIVYKNFPKKHFKLPNMDVLVFTSPLNAKVYFEKYKFSNDQKVFAIGATTAKALHELGIKKVYFPKKPSEKKLVSLVLKKIGH